VKSLPHPIFEVRDHNLWMKPLTLTLEQALEAHVVEIPHLNGKWYYVQIKHVITPERNVFSVPGLGMPLMSAQHLNGLLILQFEIKFPDQVTRPLFNNVMFAEPYNLEQKKED